MMNQKEQDAMVARLQAALDEGFNFYSVADVVEKLKEGLWQWHSRGDGVVITSIETNLLGERILTGRFIFGDMKDVLSLSDDVDEFGRKCGCTKFTMDGRVGWQRALKDYGWKPVGVIMEKML